MENSLFLANKIIEKKLSVRQAENLVKILKNPKKRQFKFIDPNLKDLEKSISDKTGLNVIIKNNKKNRGSISFSFTDLDQLNKIIDVIKFNY